MFFQSLPENSRARSEVATPADALRVLTAQRNQIALRPVDLEATVGPDHPVRNVWAFVEVGSLRPVCRDRSVEGAAGRPAIDPKILMALWLYATLDGVGSAREIERLSEVHDAYRWICGGVNVNHHTLSDFRCRPVDLLDQLLTDSVAVLMHKGLAKLERVAQDGMRVRASAGAGSFRRRLRLKFWQEQARARSKRLRAKSMRTPMAPTGVGARRKSERPRSAKSAWSKRWSNWLSREAKE